MRSGSEVKASCVFATGKHTTTVETLFSHLLSHLPAKSALAFQMQMRT